MKDKDKSVRWALQILEGELYLYETEEAAKLEMEEDDVLFKIRVLERYNMIKEPLYKRIEE